MADDLLNLADPGADRIMFWDDSATALTNLTVSTGLAISTTNLTLSFLGIQDLVDPDADGIFFWDDSAGKTDWLLAGNGLEFSGLNLQISDQAVSSTVPVKFTNGTLGWDDSSITEIDVSETILTADGYLVSDAGVLKMLTFDETGHKVTEIDAAHTFAISDVSGLLKLTGSTNRIWTIPPNSGVAFVIGTQIHLQNSSTGSCTILADTGVIIDTVNHTAAATAQSDLITVGGRGWLIKTATDTWSLSGDLTDA